VPCPPPQTQAHMPLPPSMSTWVVRMQDDKRFHICSCFARVTSHHQHIPATHIQQIRCALKYLSDWNLFEWHSYAQLFTLSIPLSLAHSLFFVSLSRSLFFVSLLPQLLHHVHTSNMA
jgi:hypothetical protein